MNYPLAFLKTLAANASKLVSNPRPTWHYHRMRDTILFEEIQTGAFVVLQLSNSSEVIRYLYGLKAIHWDSDKHQRSLYYSCKLAQALNG